MADTKNSGIRTAGAKALLLAKVGVVVVGAGVLGTVSTGRADTMQAPYCEDDWCYGAECVDDWPGMNCDQEMSYCFPTVCVP